MSKDRIRAELFRLQDVKYGAFQVKLIPTVDPASIIGVRTPELRKLAKQLYKEPDAADVQAEEPEGPLAARSASRFRRGNCQDTLSTVRPF